MKSLSRVPVSEFWGTGGVLDGGKLRCLKGKTDVRYLSPFIM